MPRRQMCVLKKFGGLISEQEHWVGRKVTRSSRFRNRFPNLPNRKPHLKNYYSQHQQRSVSQKTIRA